jgi:dTMP kinase
MLISFEGIDGSGKTTQIGLLKARLEEAGIPVRLFREPGGTDVSEAIRGLLLDPERRIDPVTEVLLFSASRSQLMVEEVLPALEAGAVVILDRFYDSTTAYQGFGRGSLPADRIDAINRIASHGRAPDVTFYLRLTRDQAEARRQDRHADRMERAGDAFYDRVIAGFDAIAESEPRVRVIDAARPPEAVHADIWSLVSRRRGLTQ